MILGRVALRKESVDRNQQGRNSQNINSGVALRKESVDRNEWIKAQYPGCRLSLSARRAWIEMTYVTRLPRAQVVALRKESVDRNTNFYPASLFDLRRSPQGERG